MFLAKFHVLKQVVEGKSKRHLIRTRGRRKTSSESWKIPPFSYGRRDSQEEGLKHREGEESEGRTS